MDVLEIIAKKYLIAHRVDMWRWKMTVPFTCCIAYRPLQSSLSYADHRDCLLTELQISTVALPLLFSAFEIGWKYSP